MSSILSLIPLPCIPADFFALPADFIYLNVSLLGNYVFAFVALHMFGFGYDVLNTFSQRFVDF